MDPRLGLALPIQDMDNRNENLMLKVDRIRQQEKTQCPQGLGCRISGRGAVAFGESRVPPKIIYQLRNYLTETLIFSLMHFPWPPGLRHVSLSTWTCWCPLSHWILNSLRKGHILHFMSLSDELSQCWRPRAFVSWGFSHHCSSCIGTYRPLQGFWLFLWLSCGKLYFSRNLYILPRLSSWVAALWPPFTVSS